MVVDEVLTPKMCKATAPKLFSILSLVGVGIIVGSLFATALVGSRLGYGRWHVMDYSDKLF